MVKSIKLVMEDDGEVDVNSEDIELKTTTDEKENVTHSNPIEPPDGGWGWIIALSCSVIVILLPMTLSVYSVIYSDILMHGGISSTTNTIIFNVCFAIWNLSGILASTLSKMMGLRKMSLLGTSLCVLGTISSAFATSPLQLFFCFSIIYGLGLGISTPVQQFIIPQYFKKMRSLMLGLNMSCISVSLFLSPLLIGVLQVSYSYRGAVLILGGIMLNCLAAGALLHPVEWHVKIKKVKINLLENQFTKENPNEKLLPSKSATSKRVRRISERSNISFQSLANTADLDVTSNSLKDITKHAENSSSAVDKTRRFSLRRFLQKFARSLYDTIKIFKSFRMQIISAGYILAVSSHMNTVMLIPFLLKQNGHSLQMSLHVLFIINFSGFVSRVLVAFIIDRLQFSAKYYFMVGAILASAGAMAFTLLTDLTLFMIASCIYGFGVGCCLVVLTMIFIEFMGIEFLQPSFGAYMFSLGFGTVIIGPLIGVIRDVSESYHFTLRTLSIIFVVSFLLWFLMPLAERLDKKKGSVQPSKNVTEV